MSKLKVYCFGISADGYGSLGIDNDFAEKGFENMGAWILGRNIFFNLKK